MGRHRTTSRARPGAQAFGARALLAAARRGGARPARAPASTGISNPFYVGNARVTERGAESRATVGRPVLGRHAHARPARDGVPPAVAARRHLDRDARAGARPAVRGALDRRRVVLPLPGALVGEDPLVREPEPRHRLHVLPVLLVRPGPREERELLRVLPLFGTIKTFAGFAEVSFFLFPLYYRAMKDIDRAGDLLQPDAVRRLGRRRAARLARGTCSRSSATGSTRASTTSGRSLWPFIHWQRNDLDTTDPTRDVTVWPPLRRRDRQAQALPTPSSGPSSASAARTTSRPTRRGSRTRRSYFRDDYLWPVYQREHTKEFDRLRLFPFYVALREPRDLEPGVGDPALLAARGARAGERGWTKRTFDFVPLRAPGVEGVPRTAARPTRTFKLWPLFSTKSEAGADATAR